MRRCDAPGYRTPFLKWAGGKRWFVPHVARYIERHLSSPEAVYIEPFVGAGALAVALGRAPMRLNDVNRNLVDVYRAIAIDPDWVFSRLMVLVRSGTDKERFYWVRDKYNRLRHEEAKDSLIERAAHFIYLNKLCFNGLYRVNGQGDFNTPYGDGRFSFPHSAKLAEVAGALRGAVLTDGDFQPVIDAAPKGALVYVDSPYDGTFDGYAGERFGAAEQTRLAAALERAHRRGVYVLANNARTDLVLSLYDWARIEPIHERRAINSDPSGRAAARCVVIMNDSEMLDERARTAA